MSRFKNALKNSLALSFALASVQIVTSGSYASDERGSACVFSREAKPSLHVDPWAPEDRRLQRFGATENSDEVTIQSCKGITDQYIALVLGNRESSLASDSGNVIIESQLGQERCDFSSGIKKIPWMISQKEREATIQSRLKTLRSCVSLSVISLNGRPLVLGSHPRCEWTTTGPNSYIARGSTCTFKVESSTAVAVKPLIEPSCLTPKRFESGELSSADLTTALQAFVTSDAKAASSESLIGTSSRRIVFAPTPDIVSFDDESILRFPKTLDLKIQPVSLDLSTQRSKDEVNSYVSIQMMVRNQGSKSSSYPVPLAAETELLELSNAPDGSVRTKTVATWTTFASGQTLIPADWSGLFVTDRAEVTDFAFKHGRRYRIRLKYFHPHDVPGLLQAELKNRPQTFSIGTNSFDVAKFPTFNMVGRVPQMSSFPTMGRGPQDNQAGSQISATEREILRFFRQLGVDEAFPSRYNRSCDGDSCISISQSTFIGQSVIDFTTDATPGQVSEMKAISLQSSTKLTGQSTSSILRLEEREGIRCN